MTSPTYTPRLLLALGLLFSALSLPAAPARADGERRLEAHVDLQNLALFRNDSDFDATLPLYRENGKSVGGLATVFRPDVTWHITSNLRVFYQAEIGLNYWGKQNPDQESYSAPDAFVLKHRELWGEGSFADGAFGFKLGYVRFRDPTGLFFDHWIGAAEARTGWSGGEASLFFGQVPDQVYEGIDISENNFSRDIDVFGLRGSFAFGEKVKAHAGIQNLYDRHVVGQTRWAVVPSVRLEAQLGGLLASLDGAVQAGELQGIALGGGDQDLLAWAVQAHLEYELSRLRLQLNALALSGDDDFDGNDRHGAFLYSGKNRSATLMLTEDELRDWYDNFDERMSAYRAGFFQNRAGLFVADLKASFAVTESLRPALIVGYGRVLNPNNALGESTVGVEADLVVEYRFSEHLVAQAAVGGFFPGKAGGALVNRIDLGRTDPMFLAEGSVVLHY